MELKREGLPVGSCFIITLDLKSHLERGWIRFGPVVVRWWIILIDKYDMGKGLVTKSWGNKT